MGAVAGAAEDAAAGEDVVVAVPDQLKDLPKLGVGMGYREPYRSDLFLNRSAVDFLEITADHFFCPNPEKQEELELLAENFILIPHALNLSLGSADGIEEKYLEQLAGLVQKLNPPWWSEHIAFTRAQGVHIGHLTPLPFTPAAVEVLCENIAQVRRTIQTPLILENISFTMRLPGAAMSEPEFLRQVLEESASGLLLDVTNLYANAFNHRYDPYEFLDQLPWERVVQLHFVGGRMEGGKFIDSHSSSTPEPIWSLLEAVLARCEVRGMILERDENFPPFAEVQQELLRARDLWSVLPDA